MNETIRNRILRNSVRKRDGDRCCWCNIVLRFERAAANQPDQATLEHLVEKCLGGSDDLDNLKLACFKCNTQRELSGADREEIDKRLIKRPNYLNPISAVWPPSHETFSAQPNE